MCDYLFLQCLYVHVYRRPNVEFIIAFLIGFFSFWFLTREDLIKNTQNSLCPSKEAIVTVARECGKNSTKLKRELREFSLLKIQDGYYEYEDVLQTLMAKEKNDKV